MATKESEIYDLILHWERELKDQEKHTLPEYRPLLSPVLKGSVMKKIACGNIREYIKTHEAIKPYEILRNEVLTMAMHCKNEANAKTQKPVPMDLNAMWSKFMAQINLGGNKNDTKIEEAPSCSPCNDGDKMLQDLMAMVKGKGKGSDVECYNCGKKGHIFVYIFIACFIYLGFNEYL